MGTDGPPRLLVLRALGLGDLLVAVPALRGLRRAHPGHHVVLAAPPGLAQLAAWSGAVDELLPTAGPADLRWDRHPPAVAVNLHGTGPQSHQALDATRPGRRIGFRAAGWDGPEFADVARRHPHERDRWCALLAAAGVPADPGDLALRPPPAPAGPAPAGPAAGPSGPSGPSGEPAAGPGAWPFSGPFSGPAPVLVHPGAQFGAKRWPGARFAAVAAALDGAGHRVLLTGSGAERELAHGVAAAAGLPPERVLAGRTDLAQLSTLVARAALLVCGDTGVAHLASAFGTPSVVLFGPVPPERWGPPAGGPHAVLTGPAARRGDPFAADPDPALLAVTVADVLAAVRSVGPGTVPRPARPPAPPAGSSSGPAGRPRS